jgi:RNA polymerase sigma factor (sigma-70 family)
VQLKLNPSLVGLLQNQGFRLKPSRSKVFMPSVYRISSDEYVLPDSINPEILKLASGDRLLTGDEMIAVIRAFRESSSSLVQSVALYAESIPFMVKAFESEKELKNMGNYADLEDRLARYDKLTGSLNAFASELAKENTGRKAGKKKLPRIYSEIRDAAKALPVSCDMMDAFYRHIVCSPYWFYSPDQKACTMLKLSQESLAHKADALHESSVFYRNILLAKNLGLIQSTAQDFLSKANYDHRTSFDDLVSEGIFSFYEALDHYNETMGSKFSSYFVWWISKAMENSLKRRNLIRVPKACAGDLGELAAAENALKRENGLSPTLEELSEYTGKTLDRIGFLHSLPSAFCASGTRTSDGSEDFSFLEMAPDPYSLDGSSVIGNVRRDLVLGILECALNDLTPRQRQVLDLRYNESMTLEEAGAELNLSRERIRQIEEKALKRLRHPSRQRNLMPAYEEVLSW